LIAPSKDIQQIHPTQDKIQNQTKQLPLTIVKIRFHIITHHKNKIIKSILKGIKMTMGKNKEIDMQRKIIRKER
jgi:hypothetical protein